MRPIVERSRWPDHDDWRLKDLRAAKAHLILHREMGHKVPEYAFELIEAKMRGEDAGVPAHDFLFISEAMGRYNRN